MTRHSFRWEMT